MPPEGIGVAGVKANVTVTQVKKATRSEEAMVNDNDVTGGCVVAGARILPADDVAGACVVAGAWFPTKLDRITFASFGPPFTKKRFPFNTA